MDRRPIQKKAINVRRRFLIALPLMLITLLYACPLAAGGRFLPLFSRRELGEIMQVEFLVVVSGLFLVFPIIAPVESIVGNTFRWIVFSGFAFILGKIVYGQYDASGLLSFVVLLYATFGPALPVGKNQSAAAGFRFMEAFVRWLVCLIIMFSLVVSFNMGGHITRWYDNEQVITAGFLYFLALSVAELIVYPLLKRFGQS